MDYSAIGKRIRRYRKELGYTQEQLAEIVNISVTHMSHIETGATKLSLECFASLADALNVKTDDLLHDRQESKELVEKEILDLLKHSTLNRLRVYCDMLVTLEDSMDRNS